MSSPVQPVTTFWRLAGMSYLQYVSRASTAVRGALKEPSKRKAEAQETFFYKAADWKGGIQGNKTIIQTLGAAGKL